MTIDVLLVKLDPPGVTYAPGQTVAGHVEIQLDSDTSIRALKVSCKGNCKVSWIDGTNETKKTYKGDEEYFMIKETVWSGDGNNGQMKQGIFQFPFVINLPLSIPSTYAGPSGQVQYTIRVTADRKLQPDKTHTVDFTVSTPYDINQNPIAKNPLQIDETKSGCFLCCSKGPLQITLFSDRSGFEPGATMLLNGELYNKGNSPMESLSIQIVQKATHRTQRRTKLVKTTVFNMSKPGIEAGQSVPWNNLAIQIPNVVATELKFCNLIDIQYEILLSASFGWCSSVEIGRPIVIGSVAPQYSANGVAVQQNYLTNGVASKVTGSAPQPITEQIYGTEQNIPGQMDVSSLNDD